LNHYNDLCAVSVKTSKRKEIFTNLYQCRGLVPVIFSASTHAGFGHVDIGPADVLASWNNWTYWLQPLQQHAIFLMPRHAKNGTWSNIPPFDMIAEGQSSTC
jgi:hypothetical protein